MNGRHHNWGSKRIYACISTACIVAFNTHAEPVYRYAIIDVGTLARSTATARGLNDLGQVVGSTSVDPFGTGPFLWDRGVMIDLGSLGGRNGQAYDINQTGQIAGMSAVTEIFDPHAFLWEQGVMYDLGSHGGGDSYGWAINDSGVVVGSTTMAITGSAETPPFSKACVWERGRLRILESFGQYLRSFPYDINNAGQVIGSADRPSGETETAVIWEPDGSIHVIPHGAHAFFTGTINNQGHVGGKVVWQKGDDGHAAVWDGEKIIDYHPAGARLSGGGIINDLDHFLGGFDGVLALWLSPETYIILDYNLPPNHGWKLGQFEFGDLNNHDQIVGWGPHRQDDVRGFLMTPVSPELALSHPVPGIAGEMNTWTITGAEPGAIITFVYGFKGGGAVINTECDLLDAVIQLDDAKYMGSAIADEAGVATLTLFVPELARELPGVMIQAFDAMNCNESQLSVVVFE